MDNTRNDNSNNKVDDPVMDIGGNIIPKEECPPKKTKKSVKKKKSKIYVVEASSSDDDETQFKFDEMKDKLRKQKLENY